MTRLHLDTDIGGDPDDACALAMLLGWPGAELTGVTTTIDPGGRRAGYAAYLLQVAGRADVPVTAGAELSLTSGTPLSPLRDLWPPTVAPAPGPLAAAHDLLAASIEAGATVVAVGPLSTLATLERDRPGTLGRARIVAMGAWTGPLDPDLPPLGPADDFNVAVDPDAAMLVARSAGELTWVPLAVTLRTAVREPDLSRVRANGPLGALLADQVDAYRPHNGPASLAREHPGLPDDLALVLHDPLACAVALGWPGVHVVRRPLTAVRAAGGVRLDPDPAGQIMGVATRVDGPAFTEVWLAAVAVAQRARQSERQPRQPSG